MKQDNKGKNIRSAGLSVLVVLILLLPAGCKKDFLEVAPQGQQPSPTFFQTQDDATKALNAAYGNLRSFGFSAFPAISVESVTSDDAEKGSVPGDAEFMNNFDNFTVTPTEGQVAGFWTAMYQEINLTNQVITNIPGINMDANLKNRYLAEAKFLRAYSYFRLVRTYGGVPLRLGLPKSESEFNIPRSTKEQVYAAIEKDLNEAAAVLPVSYGPTDLGRITKGAALALRAKVAMYQNKWSDVLSYTNQVMALGVYSLFPNYEQLFRIPNENNQESIFEIQAKYVKGNCAVSNSQYSQVQGVRTVRGGGWGFNVPSQDLANAYETGDPRRDATILFRGEVTPSGDLVPPGVPNAMYNQKSYVPFSQYPGECNEGAEQNIRVMRYAEVLLMNAEANNELGNTAAALQSLNMVRARARGGMTGILPDVTTTDKTQLRTAIWNERRVEMAMEFDRFFDLVRQGRAATVLASKGFKAGKNELMPIPQTEIDLSGGLLTQNPGY